MPLGTLDRTPPPFFRQGPSALTKLSFFSALALFLMVADTRFQVTQPLRAIVATVLHPIERTLRVPIDAWEGGSDYLMGLQSALVKEAAARRELAAQAERSLRVEQLDDENRRLRALLALRPSIAVRHQTAQVLYEAPDPFTRKVVIDRGATQGIVLASPVINEAGVLGQVTRVYPLSAEVTLLTDKDAAIPVLNLRSQQRSAAFGGPGGMELRFMAGNADVREGDLLATSGVDGVYPPGLPVAKVVTVDRKIDTAFARIVLAPTAQSDGVRHVLVLEPLGLQMPPKPEPESELPKAPQRQGGGAQMIMPRPEDTLLLPANPLFVWLSLLFAFMLNLVPFGRVPAMPDFLALVLVFWNVHQPRRVGVGVAFIFGLMMDVHDGAVLGQHALAYTLLSYFATTIHRRLLWFTVPSQAVQILPLFFAAHAVSLVVRMLAGGMFPGWNLVFAPVLEAFLWPIATWVLLAPQRRPPGAGRLGSGPAPGPPPRRCPMTELKDVEQELSRFNMRLLAAALFVLLGFGLLAARLVHLQVYKHEELATQAENNRIAVVPIVPNRGLIIDRNGVVLANNYSAYTLEIMPSNAGPLEPLIDRLAEIVDIQPRDRKRLRRLMEESKSFESLPIRTKLSDEEVARFTARRFEFPGVDIKARLFRNYPLGETGAHLLGYIGRINQAEKEKLDESEDAANYRGTEYIGKLGVEQSYEADLHGTTGFEEVETSAGGRPVRRLKSNPATPGNTLILSIDIKLQALVEQLFGDRRGALVALDPHSGEVLAFVSKPTFDPNLFVDGIDSESWKELNESIDKPLLNRALRGTYPPGSTFKPFMAIAALNTGKRSPSQVIFDGGTYQFGNHTFRSHGDHGLGPVDMVRSIVKSSNVYYYSLANDLGVDLMHEQLGPFGFGRKTGIDVDGEVTGLLPSTEWKRRAYKKPELQKWYAGETISLGIGQGYNNFTMLQLATATATLVSGGERYKPRLVREIEDVVTRERKRIANDALTPLPLKPEHVELINRALYGVTQEGTSVRSFLGAPYKTGGKTGTAQAVGVKANEKYNAAKMEEHQRDHALYVAFGPIEAPKIALAIVVENSGFGSDSAAPITRRVFDYVIAGLYPSEEDIAHIRDGKGGPPVGKQRPAASVPLPGGAMPLVPSAAAVPAAERVAQGAPR